MADHQSEYLALLESWRHRFDDTALLSLYEKMRPMIRTLLFRMEGLSNPHTVEDLTQEVCLKVMQALHRYDPATAQFTTWVGNITRNHATDYLRRRRPVLNTDTDDGDATPGSFTPAKLQTHFLTELDIDTITSYTPFRITPETLVLVGDVFVASQGRATTRAIEAVGALLDDAGVAWKRHRGSIGEVTAYLFALIRIAKAQEGDQERLERLLSNYPATSPTGLLIQFLGSEAVALLVLLYGGASVQLPRADALLKRRRRGRRPQ